MKRLFTLTALLCALSPAAALAKSERCEALTKEHRALKGEMSGVLKELARCPDPKCLSEKKEKLRALQSKEEALLKDIAKECDSVEPK